MTLICCAQSRLRIFINRKSIVQLELRLHGCRSYCRAIVETVKVLFHRRFGVCDPGSKGFRHLSLLSDWTRSGGSCRRLTSFEFSQLCPFGTLSYGLGGCDGHSGMGPGIGVGYSGRGATTRGMTVWKLMTYKFARLTRPKALHSFFLEGEG